MILTPFDQRNGTYTQSAYSEGCCARGRSFQTYAFYAHNTHGQLTKKCTLYMGHYISNPIIFIDLRSSKDYYKRPGGLARVSGRSHLGVSCLRGSMCAEGMGCERRWVKWVLREQGLPVGIQECLERFHRGGVDYLSR